MLTSRAVKSSSRWQRSNSGKIYVWRNRPQTNLLWQARYNTCFRWPVLLYIGRLLLVVPETTSFPDWTCSRVQFPQTRMLLAIFDARVHYWLMFSSLLSRAPRRAVAQPVPLCITVGGSFPSAGLRISPCWFLLSSCWSIRPVSLELTEQQLCP